MIKLYVLPPALGLRAVSPFCFKIEMVLAYLNEPFELILEPDPRKAPKSKLPYMDVDGQLIADSELILDDLEKKHGASLYGDLTPAEIGVGRAFTRLCEEHLYWMMVASRWLDDDYFPNVAEGFFGDLPPIVRSIVPKIAQNTVKKTYDLQGLGRHSKEEQIQFAKDDLSAIADKVAEDGFITGGRFSIFDINVASLISGLLENQPNTWISEIGKTYPALREYSDRIQNEVGVYINK